MEEDKDYQDWCDYVKNRNDIFYKHKKYLENEFDYKQQYFKVCFNIDNKLFNYELKKYHNENPKYKNYTEEDRFEAGYEKCRYEKLIKENEYWKLKYEKLMFQFVYGSSFYIPSLSKVFNLLEFK
jgi:hypothetical protein